MKTSTIVSFITLSGLMSTNAFASALPHDELTTSLVSPGLLQRHAQDDAEHVLSSDEKGLIHNLPPNTRRSRSRFRKQAARIPIGSEDDTTRVDLGPNGSDPIGLSATPDINLRRDTVHNQVPDIAPGVITNSTLHQVNNPGVLSKSDRNAMSASVRNTQSTTQDLQDAPNYFGPTTHVRTTKRDETDLTDIQYLNYALVIEQLLYAHYLQALRRFSETDFRNAGFPDWVRGRFREMAEHERMHKEFLESAIVAAGSDHVQPANYDFQDQDVHSFIDTSMALESIAASAYIGVLQFFNNKAYVTTEAAMLADRARQAAWINSAVRKQNPWNTAFETPLTPQQVFTLLSVFVNDETSPKPNKALLPNGLHPSPRLTLSPRLVPGEQAEISFPYSDPTDGTKPNFLYVAFMSGVETILGRVLDRDEPNNNDGDDGGETVKRHFVEIPRDLASRGVVYVVVLKGVTDMMADVRMDDESVVAGPAIATFPFDAGSRPI